MKKLSYEISYITILYFIPKKNIIYDSPKDKFLAPPLPGVHQMPRKKRMKGCNQNQFIHHPLFLSSNPSHDFGEYIMVVKRLSVWLGMPWLVPVFSGSVYFKRTKLWVRSWFHARVIVLLHTIVFKYHSRQHFI